MSQIRMQNHFGAVRSEERYNVDADVLREIKQVRYVLNYNSVCIMCISVECCFDPKADMNILCFDKSI